MPAVFNLQVIVKICVNKLSRLLICETGGCCALKPADSDHLQESVASIEASGCFFFLKGLLFIMVNLLEMRLRMPYFVKRAHVIVVREGILLEEIFSDDFGDFQRQLLVLGQRVSTHQLDDFVQFSFFCQNVLDGFP